MAISKRSLERIASIAVPARLRSRILYYHSVHPTAPLAVRPQAFAAQLSWLRENGRRVVLFREAAAACHAGSLDTTTVAITFDDGYGDNARYALPALAAEGFSATFFVISGFVGRSTSDCGAEAHLYGGRSMMTSDQLRGLVAAGMEIGSHTRSHVHVRRLIERDPGAALEELRGSREDLESITGAAVESFAYPNGQKGVFSPATQMMLATSGYRWAATTMWGALSATCDPLQLPRIEIRHDDSTAVFGAKLRGRYDFLTPYCHLVDRSRRW